MKLMFRKYKYFYNRLEKIKRLYETQNLRLNQKEIY